MANLRNVFPAISIRFSKVYSGDRIELGKTNFFGDGGSTDQRAISLIRDKTTEVLSFSIFFNGDTSEQFNKN